MYLRHMESMSAELKKWFVEIYLESGSSKDDEDNYDAGYRRSGRTAQ